MTNYQRVVQRFKRLFDFDALEVSDQIDAVLFLFEAGECHFGAGNEVFRLDEICGQILFGPDQAVIAFALFLPLCLVAVYASRKILGVTAGQGVGIWPPSRPQENASGVPTAMSGTACLTYSGSNRPSTSRR